MAERDELILANLIANRAATHPELDVLTFENEDCPDEVRTYRQLWMHGCQIAKALKFERMEKGDYFAILMHNHPEFVEIMIAASTLGLVFVPIDPRTRGEKLVYLLTHSGCKGVICADYVLEALLEVQEQLSFITWLWVLGPGTDAAMMDKITKRSRLVAEILESPFQAIEVVTTDPAEPMEIMYTSGTTGDPKGVVITHARWGSIASWHELLGYQRDDRPYSGLSLTHGNAQLVTLACSLKSGMRAVFSRRFSKSRFWGVIRKYDCTVFSLLGGMATALYSEPPQVNDAENPVRYVISAGMPSEIWEDFERRFDVRILEFYAAVEGGLSIKPIAQGPIGSIGKPPATLVFRLVDDYGADVPVGTQGELIFQRADAAPFQVHYLHDPEASAKKTRGGWLRSGDIGHLDDNGWLYFDFRAGSAIRHNGEFINPARIEKLLAESPLVADVFVYGVKAQSGSAGEKDVVAAVVPVSNDLSVVAELFSLCRAALEPNSVPGYIQLLEEIPKTVSEKPIERFLLEAFHRQSSDVFSEYLVRPS
ncbi:MAG TPA: AMP-binding protein [Pseudomonas sp.]|nr:AMP-binding protein [Pseudomonas sp.]